MFNDEFITMTK